jgi:O-antigen/teichoic acid export membrane protein
LILTAADPQVCETSSTEGPRQAVLSRLAKGTSIYTIGTLLGKLLLLATQVFLARALQISGYGLYNVGFSALILLQSLALMGLDQSVLRYAALYRNRGQAEFIKGTLLASLVTGLAASVLASAALILLSPVISARLFHAPGLSSPLKIFACALPFYIVARITGSFAQSHHDILRMTNIQQVSQPGLNLLLVAALFLLGGGLRAAVWAFTASTAFSAAVGAYSIHSIFPEFFTSLRVRIHGFELVRYSLALTVIAILYQMFWRAPILLLGHFSGAAEAGLFSAAATLASPPGFISQIFAQPFMPTMVDLYEQGKFRELESLYATVTRWTQLVVIPSFGVLVLFRKQIVALFGRDFRGAEWILITMGLAWMVYYAKGPVSAVLDMTGRQFIDLANLAGVMVLFLGLGLFLIPRFGAKGAGLAIAMSVLAWSAAELIEGWIFFQFPPFNRHLFQSLLLAGVVFGGGFLIQDHVSLAVEAIVIGSLYLLLTFLCVLTESDRDLLRRAMKKVSLLVTRPAVAPAQD